MKKYISIIFLLCVMFISGCSFTLKDEAETITVTDLIGMESNIKPGSYKRVVCIGGGALRLYAYICGSENLVGVEDIENKTVDSRPKMFDNVARPYYIRYEEDFSKLPSCGVGGPNMQVAEAEKILNCNPDIIISEYTDTLVAQALIEQVGVPVITLSYGSQGVFDERLKQSLLLLGTVFDKADRAKALTDYIEQEKQNLQDLTKDVAEEEKPLVYIGGLGNWGTTNHLFTSSNYAPFGVANIKNAASDLALSGIQKIEEEKFITLGATADIIILDAASIKNIKPLYQNDPTMFDTIKAFNENKVYLQLAYNAYYTNVELALVNAWYSAYVVYQNLFENFDINEKLDEVTMMFLGEALSEQINAYPFSYGGYQQIDIEELLK